MPQQRITILKYPFSSGAGLDRSYNTPEIVHKITGDILSPHIKSWKNIPAPQTPPSRRKYKKMRNYAAVKNMVTKHGEAVAETILSGSIPLTIGGDHTQGIGTIKGAVVGRLATAILKGELSFTKKSALAELEDALEKQDIQQLAFLIKKNVDLKSLRAFLNDIAVIWIDAHADYNNRNTSPSGNIHGMSLAACAGHDVGGIEALFAGDVLALNPQNFYILCGRSIDRGERQDMLRDGVNFKNWEMTKPGNLRNPADPFNKTTLKKALDKILISIGNKPIILSVDIDAIHAEPHYSPYGLESVGATGTPCLNGPSANDMFEALYNILARPNIIAADLSEISPAEGLQGQPQPEQKRGLTLQTGMRVLAAMLGADLKRFSRQLAAKRPLLKRLVGAAIRSEARLK